MRYRNLEKTGKYPIWIKLDIVIKSEKILFEKVSNEIIKTRRNYVDFGVAFDDYWDLSFYQRKSMPMHLSNQ